MASIVETWTFAELFEAFRHAPIYHLAIEGVLIIFVVILVFSKSYKPKKEISLTEKERKELIAEWQPEPLVPENTPESTFKVVSMQRGSKITVDGKTCLNLATFNFLGLLGNKNIEEAALKSLHKYGVGACGPRGFYGTFDVHIELEERLAKFLNAEEAALYSYGFSTIASVIPAYAKRGDIIFCDEGISFPVQMGIVASRSVAKYFKHNDINDFERILEKQAVEDQKNPKKARVTRRFLMIEGLYFNYGDIPPLPKLIELKKKYKFRLFIEESYSLGVLGKTGRGITEYYNVSMDNIDLITSSVENSFASIGGACIGSSFVIDHQRLASGGYCFSASLPPMLAASAIESLNIMENNPNLLADLRDRSEHIHELLKNIPGFYIEGLPYSPIKHLRLSGSFPDRAQQVDVLERVAEKAMNKGIALSVAKYLENEEKFLPKASIRIAVNLGLSKEDLTEAAKVILKSVEETLAEHKI